MAKKKKSLDDYFAIGRLNTIMYIIIVLAVFMVLYFVVVQYMIYKGLAANKIDAQIVTNDVQSFSDGMHPVVTLRVSTRLESRIAVNVEGEKDEDRFSFMNDGHVKEYSKLIVFSREAANKEFTIRVIAEDKGGIVKEKLLRLKTKKADMGGVKFSVN